VETFLFARLYERARSAIALLRRSAASKSDFRIDQIVLPVLVYKGAHELHGNAFLIDPERGIFVTCAHVLGFEPRRSRVRINVFFDGAWHRVGRHGVFKAYDVAFFRIARSMSHLCIQYASEFPKDGLPLQLMGFRDFRMDDDPPAVRDVPLLATRVTYGLRTVSGKTLRPDSVFVCRNARSSDTEDFFGFSGSPVLSRSGTVFGMLQGQTATRILISISMVRLAVLLQGAQRSFDTTP